MLGWCLFRDDVLQISWLSQRKGFFKLKEWSCTKAPAFFLWTFQLLKIGVKTLSVFVLPQCRSFTKTPVLYTRHRHYVFGNNLPHNYLSAKSLKVCSSRCECPRQGVKDKKSYLSTPSCLRVCLYLSLIQKTYLNVKHCTVTNDQKYYFLAWSEHLIWTHLHLRLFETHKRDMSLRIFICRPDLHVWHTCWISWNGSSNSLIAVAAVTDHFIQYLRY